MSLGLPDVRVRLTAEGEAQIINALRKVTAESQRSGRVAARGFGQFNTALSGASKLLAQITAVASVAAFVALARRAADAADQIGKMSQRVGASVENLSALGLVAKTSDIDMKSLTRSMVFLSRRIAELQGGSKDAARDFAALNLTARDFKGRDAAENLDVVARAFANLADSPQKTALSFRFFGRQVADILPLLNALGGEGGLGGAIQRARELGVLISEDTARAAQAINDDFTVIREQVLAGAARFVEGLAPAIHITLLGIQDDLGQNQDAWKTWGEVVGRIVGLTIITIQQSFDDLFVSLLKINNVLGALARVAIAPLGAKGAVLLAENLVAAEKARQLDIDAAARRKLREEQAERLGEATTRGAAGLPPLRPRGPQEEAPVLDDETERKRQEAEAKRLAAEKERLRIAELKRIFDAQTAAGEVALAELAERRAEIEQRVALGLLSQAEGAKQVEAATRDMLPALRDLLRSYVLIAHANPFDEEAWARARQFAAALREIEVEVEAVDDLMARLDTTAREALQGALVRAFTSAIEEGEKLLDVLRNIGLAILQAVQQLLAFELAKSIVGAIPGFSGGGRAAGRAEGGLISGPGTATSDSIPARLSRGEFVMRAAAVQQPGMLEALDAINRGLAAPALSESRGVRRFADGGFVSGAGVTRHETSVTLGLEDGLVAREIESPAGERAVVRVVGKNPRAVGSSLRRG